MGSTSVGVGYRIKDDTGRVPISQIGCLRTLIYICDITLTDDFWAVSLPQDLATSSARSPSLFAYL